MDKDETLWQIGESHAPLPPSIKPEQVSSGVKFYLEQYRTYGPIFRVPRSHKPLTVLAGPEANVLMTRVGTELLGHQVFWQEFDKEYTGNHREREGEANRIRRAVLSRSYSRGRILDRLASLVEMADAFTSSWEAGQSISFYPWVQRLVAEQLGQLLTHHGPGEYFPDLLTFLRTAVSATLTKTQEQRALHQSGYQQARQRVFEMGRAVIEEHRVAPSTDREPDLVDDLLAARGKDVANDQIAYAVLGPFLAGLDTVSTSASYLLYALLKHQDILARVLVEVDAVFAQGELSWEQLKTMQALHGAAMETLRLYALPNGHLCQARQPFTFAGYRVEQNEEVFVAITVAHFLPELFPDPLRFDIDRYHDPRNEHRQRGAYAPFGVGDRSCLGAGIAEIQLMVTIATLLSRFQLALEPPDCELHPLGNSSLSLKNDFHLRVIARRHRLAGKGSEKNASCLTVEDVPEQ